MSDASSAEESPRDGPPYPEARRTYRILGIVHGLLFGVGVAAAGIQEGDIIMGVAAGILVGGLFFGVFHRLAEDHYRGNVPGKPGAWIHTGGKNDDRN